MEDETQAASTAVIEADAQALPPDDAAAAVADAPATAGPTLGEDGLPELAPDFSNVDQWLAAAEARINADAAQAEAAAATEDGVTDAVPTATGAAEATAAAPRSDAAPEPAQATDYTKLVADLQARGFKVEPPAPPPDPFAELRNELAPYVGNERYEQLKAVALQELPAEPPAYDSATVEAHEAKVREVNAAKAELRQMDVNRRIHGSSYAWARQQVLNDAGAELASTADKYGADPARVGAAGTPPKSVIDAVDAVAEAVERRVASEWQAKYDAREKFWQGKVRQAQADASVDRHRAIGTAPQASPPPGGGAASRPGASLFDLDPRTGLPTEASIQRAIRGEFAHVDLSDR